MVEFWLGTFPTIGRARDVAEMAEADGWDGLAFTDSQNLHGDTFAQLALAAHATKRLRLATGATNFVGPFFSAVSATEATVQGPVPVAGTAANLVVSISTSPGGGWRRSIDTSLAAPDDLREWDDAPVVGGTTYVAGARSVVLLAGSLASPDETE